MQQIIGLVKRAAILTISLMLKPVFAIIHLIQMFPKMWAMLKDPRVPWYIKVSFVATCILYVISPIDLIPEGGAALAGFIPPVAAALFVLGVSEDFLLGIPLIGKLFLWWANRHIQKQLPRSDDASG